MTRVNDHLASASAMQLCASRYVEAVRADFVVRLLEQAPAKPGIGEACPRVPLWIAQPWADPSRLALPIPVEGMRRFGAQVERGTRSCARLTECDEVLVATTSRTPGIRNVNMLTCDPRGDCPVRVDPDPPCPGQSTSHAQGARGAGREKPQRTHPRRARRHGGAAVPSGTEDAPERGRAICAPEILGRHHPARATARESYMPRARHRVSPA